MAALSCRTVFFIYTPDQLRSAALGENSRNREGEGDRGSREHCGEDERIGALAAVTVHFAALVGALGRLLALRFSP